MNEATSIDFSMTVLIAGVLLMLLLAMSVILFFLIYQKRLAEQGEEIRRMELDYQKDLLQSSIAVQEAERKRIAYDIHDSLGSSLAAIKLFVNQLPAHGQENRRKALLTDVNELLDQSVLSVRSITRNLLPKNLEQFGLMAALEDLCAQVDELEETNVQLHGPSQLNIPTTQELALYRIAQELLNNAIKHAKASTIVLTIEAKTNELHFHYQDDGIGFDMPVLQQQRQTPGGLGWKSIESRLHLLDGQLAVQTAIGQGVVIDIKIPQVKKTTDL